MQKLRSPHEIKELRLCLEASETTRPVISVCASATCGMASGAAEVYTALQKELKRVDAAGVIDLKSTGCHGLCEKEPTVRIWPDRVSYNKVSPSDAEESGASLLHGR